MTGWAGRKTDRDRFFKSRQWRELRERVYAEAGGKCELCGCVLTRGQPRNPHNFECDHKGDRMNHDRSNLRALCRTCHLNRSSTQGGGAKHARHKYVPSPKLRRNKKTKHPGLL